MNDGNRKMPVAKGNRLIWREIPYYADLHLDLLATKQFSRTILSMNNRQSKLGLTCTWIGKRKELRLEPLARINEGAVLSGVRFCNVERPEMFDAHQGIERWHKERIGTVEMHLRNIRAVRTPFMTKRGLVWAR
jgi:hypothetical protein